MRLLALAAAVTVLGCGQWDEFYSITDAVWSDDDSRIVYVEWSQEERIHLNEVVDVRREKYRLYLLEPDTGEAMLLRTSKGSFGDPVLFRSQGRVLWRLRESVHDLDVETRDTRTVATAGDGRRILTALPSPDGSLVAIESADTRPALVDTSLTILDWESLEPVWGPQAVPEALPFGWWTPEGSFYVGESRNDASRAFLWSPDGSISVVDRPECRPPRAPGTTSSPISASGEILCGGSFEEVHVCSQAEVDSHVFPNIPPTLPFGCPDGV